MNTATPPVYEWNTRPWKQIERRVFKLQKRIYQASQRGDTATVHKLQRLLLRFWSAKQLAVRQVTQDNQGKRTAGIDGVKSLTPPQRHARDRATQALVKLALEPEWEARFEPNSYGFRPGRSGHDAIEAIRSCTCLKPKYVLDADIAKCFDRINHQALLTKLATFPTLRRCIRRWLQAGVMNGSELFPTTAGTPQGGVISPLLANVALHGLETMVQATAPRHKVNV